MRTAYCERGVTSKGLLLYLSLYHLCIDKRFFYSNFHRDRVSHLHVCSKRANRLCICQLFGRCVYILMILYNCCYCWTSISNRCSHRGSKRSVNSSCVRYYLFPHFSHFFLFLSLTIPTLFILIPLSRNV